jgi:hypothetical protein
MTNNRKDYLDKTWQHDLDWARKTLIDKGAVAQMIVVHTQANNRAIVVSIRPGVTKDEACAFARHVCVAYNADAVTVMGEAWMLRGKDGKPADTTAPPSESPDRIEVLAVSMSSRDDTGAISHRASYRPIERGADDKPAGLGAEVKWEGVQYVGRFAEILPERKPTFTEQRIARKQLDAARDALRFAASIHQPSATVH